MWTLLAPGTYNSDDDPAFDYQYKQPLTHTAFVQAMCEASSKSISNSKVSNQALKIHHLGE